MSLVKLLEDEEESELTVKSENQNEIHKMREVLTSIACEMQRFHDSTFDSESEVTIPEYKEKQNVFAELLKCKSKMKSKRDRIHKLRSNLKTACSVAKVVVDAKENESQSLKKNLDLAREECTDLVERHQSNIEVINRLTQENDVLHSKYNNVANFIRLGYEELQKIRGDAAEELTPLEQLRKLIVCCGQYYADYRNKHDECQQLKHKNSFLTNKNLILENNINALSQQLKALEYRNFTLQKENDKCKRARNNIEVAYSEVKFTRSSPRDSSSDDEDCKIEENKELYELNLGNGLDLTPHLSMVQKLLHCQDALLKDLKSLSDEFMSST